MEIVCVVERGNTRWKVAFFHNETIDSVHASEVLDYTLFEGISISKLLLTGSGSWEPDTEKKLQSVTEGDFHIYRHGDKNKLQTEVTDPRSLGTDRVANSFAVTTCIEEYMKERSAWLVVDIGTCVTSDLIVRGVHKGGSISPGIEMRLQSMHTGTASLPMVSDLEKRGLGLNTHSALTEGALGGVEAEITGRWNILKIEHPDLGIILTGGGSYDLELGQVQPKFADSNLTLKGYYALLQ